MTDYESLKNEVLKDFEDEILKIDYQEILKRYKSEYTTPFKVFNKNYKLDKKLFLGLRKDIRKNIKDSDIINILYTLEKINRLHTSNIENEIKWKEVYNNYYNDVNTDISILLTKYKVYKTLVNIRSIF